MGSGSGSGSNIGSGSGSGSGIGSKSSGGHIKCVLSIGYKLFKIILLILLG